ncbi:hypothetical protein AB4510_06035 [Vibrio sp. 10N.222.54.B12]|jgi:hypothetical protein|uniref:DUF5983 domain-containing protein n=2 Tax=Vibrio cyclitrophicus TaxID=47951 RepID=A0A7Z1MLH8_9VIBR|nr:MULTISPECIES: hypothetical protein [Vibrio]MCC4789116.1 hypothetical protein [Vibrio splendidus]PMP21832.1 hypothetical protein BCS91_18830 [Vibrio cyclitrophicus]PMP31614.1 hypothetical protein BCS90_11515 [Vibrio cyclitrophicus]TKG09015.1 hypothetical protein FCV67_07850 [Vibrio sp. F13]
MINSIQTDIQKFAETSSMELYLSLALSTSHLTKDDSERLSVLVQQHSNTHTHVLEREYGYFIKLQAADPDDSMSSEGLTLNTMDGMSDTFNQIMAWATSNHIGLIEFDRDANQIPLFETFDW